jgi:hypothetical protein
MSVSSAINLDPAVLDSGSTLSIDTITIPLTSYGASPTIYTTIYTLTAGTYLITGTIFSECTVSYIDNIQLQISEPTAPSATVYTVQKSYSNNAPTSAQGNNTLTLTCILQPTSSETITISVIGTPSPATAGGLSVSGSIQILTLD